MTKLVKWYKKVSFWNKIRAVIALFGVGGEATVWLTSQGAVWHVVVVCATAISLLLSQFIQDSNNNGIVDSLEGSNHTEDKK